MWAIRKVTLTGPCGILVVKTLCMSLSGFDPLIQRWFAEHFERPTEPQWLGWREIGAGRDTLISAPTGSGKTLAAFLICLDRLIRAARSQTLPNETQVVYVSPLKALSNDVHRNLELPLAQLAALAERDGISLLPIRTSVRTGDTPMFERAQMLKKPPHILVTTPESLFILLTAERSRQMLRSVSTVIVDEIHAIADDKRGSHLMLSLARLDALTTHRAQRISLSATVKPIEEVACLFGSDTRIVDVGHRREMDLAVETPRDELGAVASTELWNEIYDRLAELILANRTTLVFVNTRRLSERGGARAWRAAGVGSRSAAPWEPIAAIATQCRIAVETRRSTCGGRNSIARTWYRHWNNRPGMPDWLAAVDRCRSATDWPVWALGGRKTKRPFVCNYAG